MISVPMVKDWFKIRHMLSKNLRLVLAVLFEHLSSGKHWVDVAFSLHEFVALEQKLFGTPILEKTPQVMVLKCSNCGAVTNSVNIFKTHNLEQHICRESKAVKRPWVKPEYVRQFKRRGDRERKDLTHLKSIHNASWKD